MTIFEHPIHTLRGAPSSLEEFHGKAMLLVNVASRCGLTPQYTGLEQLQKDYADRGLVVVGFPCNQFGAQEPGSATEIETFCSTTYGVTFPMMEKIDVNGEARHPIYTELTAVADGEGHAGDIRWNFEKFLVAPDGAVTRFSPMVSPEDPALVAAIELGAARLTVTTGPCESCGAEGEALVPVHRTYVTPEAGDAPGSARTLDAVERWCFACRTHYPHEAAG